MKIDQRGIVVQDDFIIILLDENLNFEEPIIVEARDSRSAVRKALNELADDVAIIQTFKTIGTLYRIDIAGQANIIGIIKKKRWVNA